ncbi:LacI family DNA-binding transcriptional regulator [Phycisphaerales bacterium AB-hyl4]|uniref:LacI family DNA-binding transcriptional regulator n=1 Tax=Natronomicrosphaera hydrolytica TaxID=3242702 RepID=A0ABV4U9Q6_9BACT
MNPSLREIADRVELSYQTVANVLSVNSKTRVRYSTRTQQKIQAVAKQMGYRPHLGARSISTGRFGSLSLLMSTHSKRRSLPQDMLDGMLRASADLGLHLSVETVDRVLTDPKFVPRMLREWCSDGLLVDFVGVPSEMEQLISDSQVPTVWINRKRHHDTVRPDDFQAGQLAAETLLALGHRRIAYVQLLHSALKLPQLHYSVTDRIEGFQTSVQAAGLKSEVISFDQALPQAEIESWATAFLSDPDRPTAVVAADVLERETLLLGCARLNLRVPEDLSILAFASGKLSGCEVGWQSFTNVAVDWHKVGDQSVRMLVRVIENHHVDPILIPFELTEGQTTAPLPA